MAATEPFVDINALSGFLMSIGSYHVDLVWTPQNEINQANFKLYHYTDLAGLLGIVQNHDLWLTHSLYSNDSEEMVHGAKVVKGVIDEAIKNKQYDDAYLQELSRLTSEPEGVYICCFCRNGNLLSQWRGYGANGAGVSLEFAPNPFTNVAGPDNTHGLLRFWKVFYNPDTQKKIIGSALKHYSPGELQNKGEALPALARKAADAVRFFIPTFKNLDFKEEDEWRLVFTPAPNIQVQPQFRVCRGMLVPYYRLRDLSGAALPILPLEKICIGPSANKELNLKSVQALIQKSGYSTVTVDVSNTSFRA
ncbi:MAG TPA: DUF2971 domain-containing protein [Candidatus Solibacter sp.]|nr:DUF2971 domain-containing protein [Candidatus Solibacter sp.]